MRQVAVFAALAGLVALSSATFCWQSGTPPCICPPQEWCTRHCTEPNTKAYCACYNIYCECQCVTQMQAFNISTTPEIDISVATRKYLDQRDSSPISLNQEEHISAEQSTNTDAPKESPSTFITSHISSKGQEDTVILEADPKVAEKTSNNVFASATRSSSKKKIASTRVYPTKSVTSMGVLVGYCHGDLVCYPVEYRKNCICFWTDKPIGGSKVIRFALATPAPTQPLVKRREGGVELTFYEPVIDPGRPSVPGASTEKLIFRRTNLDHLCPDTTEAVCEGEATNGFKCFCKNPGEIEEPTKDKSGKATNDETLTKEESKKETTEPSSESPTASEITLDVTTTTSTYEKPSSPSSSSSIFYASGQISILNSIHDVAPPLDPTAPPIAGIPASQPPSNPAAPAPPPNTAQYTYTHELNTWTQFSEPDPKTVVREAWQESILMSIKLSTPTGGLTADFYKGVSKRIYTHTTDWVSLYPVSPTAAVMARERKVRQVEVEEVKVMTVTGVVPDEVLEEQTE